MNYRHAYHAGNFADVVKHAVLARIIGLSEAEGKGVPRHRHSCRGRPLRSFVRGSRKRPANGRDGIGRLLEREFQPEAAVLLAPYLDAVRACNRHGASPSYPGSPLIVRHLLAQAGPAVGHRTSSARRACTENAVRRRLSRSALSNSTAGWRSARICRRRKSAGWCWSIRLSRRPANSTASSKGIGQSASTLAGRHLCALVSDQGSRRREPVSRRSGRYGNPENP